MECNGGVYNISIDEISGELPDGSERILTPIILPLIALIGVFSNGSFIFVVSRLKHMRTPTNYYLVTLAIADTLDVCSGVGDKLLLYHSSPLVLDESGYGGNVGCMLTIFVTTCSYFCTLFLITLVSLEKFYAVCHPLRMARSRSGRRAMKAIISAFLVATLLSLTFLPYCGVKVVQCLHWPQDYAIDFPSTRVWYATPTEWLYAYILIMRVAPFFMISVANCVCYVRIMRALGSRVAAMETHGRGNLDASLYTRNIVARMLVVSGTTHLVLLAPLELTQLCLAVGYLRGGVYVLDYYQANVVFQVTRVLSYINSAVNPFIYSVVNRKYREAYQLAFRCNNR